MLIGAARPSRSYHCHDASRECVYVCVRDETKCHEEVSSRTQHVMQTNNHSLKGPNPELIDLIECNMYTYNTQ
jgi:hypothetical protein